MGQLLNEINQQLADQGLYIKSSGGSIVDASVTEAQQCRPNKKVKTASRPQTQQQMGTSKNGVTEINP